MKQVAFLFAMLLAGAAQAALREEQIEVPVEVTDGYGKQVRHAIKVTVFSDDAATQPRPVLVINHGRGVDAQSRLALGRARYEGASHWFVQRGFIVVVPTRIGYGETGGEDIEDTGTCRNKRFAPEFLAAAKQIVAALDAVRARPEAMKDRAVIIGQSVGGASTVALASLNPPGVAAAVNFAGGGGGDPRNNPTRPCASPQLERAFGGFGKTAKVPMLWIYAENDRYWGASLPRDWHQAYAAGGAPVEFIQLPPHGDDGHLVFTQFPQVWQPLVTKFLQSQGYAMKREAP